LERFDDGTHRGRRRGHRFVDRTPEASQAGDSVLDFMEIVQQGGVLRWFVEPDPSSPTPDDAGSTPASAPAAVGRVAARTSRAGGGRGDGPARLPHGLAHRSRRASCAASGTHTAVRSPAR
jgi:hypothetical protein